ncbi:hypothetical protein KAM622c_31670 [Klebsiella quasipneumoniae subsp. quasipneumoniae]|nr:hypothetical protein KAM622c_31670 [Klebsiella quasipneumoniae subsp. quasipneumoniae]
MACDSGLFIFQLVPNHIGVIFASPVNKIKRLQNVGVIPCIEVELFITQEARFSWGTLDVLENEFFYVILITNGGSFIMAGHESMD